MGNLGDALPIECARVRELILEYRSLPNGVGAFGIMTMESKLRDADKAMISGDVVEMLKCYSELKECK